MPKPSCSICKTTWAHENVSMFHVPRNSELREMWNVACDNILGNRARICEKHFLDDDYVKYPESNNKKRKRLKPFTVPSINLKYSLRQLLDAEEKNENKNCYESESICDESAQRNVKFINEELFDETLDVEVDKNSALNCGQIYANSNSTTLHYTSKGTQTGCHTDSEYATRACGIIEATLDKKIYNINCFYCPETFVLWSWAKFLTHMKDKHYSLEQSFQNNNLISVDNDIVNQDSLETRSQDSENVEQKQLRKVDYSAGSSLNIPCDICGSTFRNETHLQVHQTMRHCIEEFSHKCTQCNWSYVNADKLHNHITERHDKDGDYDCVDCKKKFHNKMCYKQHLSVHLICERCEEKLPTVATYRMHKLKHEPPLFNCEICSKPYYHRQRFRDHMKAHRNERDYVCEKCGNSFVRRKGLTEHIKTVHGVGLSYPCNICGHAFKSAFGLHRHRRKCHVVLEGTIEQLWQYVKPRPHNNVTFIIDPETNLRRLVCDICGNTYGHHTGLRRHKINMHGFFAAPPKKRKTLNDYATDKQFAQEAYLTDEPVAETMEECIIESDYDDFEEEGEEFICNIRSQQVVNENVLQSDDIIYEDDKTVINDYAEFIIEEQDQIETEICYSIN